MRFDAQGGYDGRLQIPSAMVSSPIHENPGRPAWRKYGLVFALLAVAQFRAGAETPEVARVATLPSWVKPQAVDLSPAKPDDDTAGGALYLLADEQTNAQDFTSYQHYATKYLSRNGVEDGSRITIVFDPTYEKLTLNKLVVYRDGKAVDRLASQEVKLLQREEGLEQRLYDGRFSAVMLLEDIRVGDVVEYAYTIQGTNPIFDGNFMDSFDARWGTPLHRFYHRLLWPAGRQLAVKSFDGDFAPTVTKGDAFTEYVWEKNDIPALISDGELPSWYNPYQWVQLSEFQTWAGVNAWALKLLALPDKAPASLMEQAAPLRSIADPKKRAVEALRFVQKNIRYLGMEVGAHSHKPYPVETVLQRRFGDCKDKALLLCALLHELGLEAYPALVDTDLRLTLSEWLPTALAFNHCVVQLRLDGRIYWLDATMSDQGGGLDQIYFPDYGYALVVKPGADALTRITPGGYDALGYETTETYVISDFKGTAKLDVHSVYRGRTANGMRSWLADNSREERQKYYLNNYAKQYPDIRTDRAPVFADDFEKNEVTSDISYTVSNFWQPDTEDAGKLYCDFYPQSIRGAVDKPDTSLRSMPLKVPYPKRLAQVFKITMPKGVRVEPEELKIDDPAFKYSSKRTVDGSQVTLRYAYETLADHVDAGRTAEYLKHVSRMLDDLDYEVRIKKTLAENSVAATPAAPSSAPVALARPSPQFSPWWMGVPFIVGGLYWVFRAKKERLVHAKSGLAPEQALHRCARCGRTEHSAPEVEFRVARDGEEYCITHLPKTS